ncbi:FAD-dependent oxidoreductase [Noviherbaspirillum suwonense]|uniref:Rubredoxin-NAD+ reductase n=1 Tax=Noviherbaspirillum suwonense TaxID=1224511 RepID=A0ABY1PSI8_9BURK|nr:FAD-dependent oxidoreductase [Noviherbaspirillum suwonense]SMP43596.1 rubredoxin-NAD+ reductase [Noviherbaspirillum suwonense]
MRPIIIIGAGMAGYTAARELRKLDKTVPLTIVTADDGGFYSKPMLSNAYAQNKLPTQLVTQTATQLAAQLDATIMTGTRVERLDTAGRKLVTDKGELDYDKLVFAVGAHPIRLPLEGDAADQAMSVNHVEDYVRFRQQLDATEAGRRARVTILGAGLIGCEFADDLAGGGHAVTLIDPNPLPLAALAAPALSEGLQASLTERGVDLRLGTTASRVERGDGGLNLTLANGATVQTDILLSAVGLRPSTTLAATSGLTVNRGIVVDSYGRSSAPDVYALGDCAEYTEADGATRIMPYIAPLMNAARAIARTLTGTPTAIDLKPSAVIVKTPCYPLALVPPPQKSVAQGSWATARDDKRTICRFYDADGLMAGFGMSHHDAAGRQALMAELGKPRDAAPGA